jgi:hypothetical protein
MHKCVSHCQFCAVLCLLIGCGTQPVGRVSDVRIPRNAFLFLIWVKVDPSAFLLCDLLWPTNFPFSWPIISHFPFTCFRYKTQRRVSFFSSVFLAHSVVQVDSGYVDEMRPQSVYSGMLFLVYVAIGNLLCSISFSSLKMYWLLFVCRLEESKYHVGWSTFM